MRQGLFILLIAIIGSTYSSCGSVQKINYKNPKQVSLKFYKALGAQDYEQAKKLGTTSTQQVLSMLQNLDDLLPEEEQLAIKTKMEAQLKRLKKSICTIEGEQAECRICCNELGEEEANALQLKKVDKKWLVHLTKEALKTN